MENRIQTLSRQLAQADRLATLGALADTVGHELSNITTICLGTVHLMEVRSQTGLPADPKHLDTLKRVGAHLRAHSSHLRNLARPSASSKQPVDLRTIVTDTLTALQSTGKTKYIALESAIPDTPAVVMANRTELEQVLINLIGNAVDALAEVPDRRGLVRITVENEAAHVSCRVEDNGCGIPEDKLGEVFQTYYTTKPPDRGTGLGLAIAKQIVEAHSGKLRVQSELGTGTSFTFGFPTLKGEADEPSEQATNPMCR